MTEKKMSFEAVPKKNSQRDHDYDFLIDYYSVLSAECNWRRKKTTVYTRV